MAVTHLQYKIETPTPRSIAADFGHAGIVASGDLEVLMERAELSGAAEIDIKTKVVGYDEVWEAVIQRFVERNSIGNIRIEINDNAATPAVVTKRLAQALNDAGGLA